MTGGEERSGGIQSLDRAFALLELMAAAGGEVALSDLAHRSGLPLPTVHRIARTLLASGYLRQLPSRRYALGPRLIGLGESASRVLGTWARPQLADLVESTGETANMAMLDGDHVVYVAQVPSRHSVRMFTEVGRRVPVHCTGVGKAVLSQLAPAEVSELLARTGMPAQTTQTITDPELFADELSRIRERGYAVDDGEQEAGVRCIAVPLWGAMSRVAVSVSGPASRLSWDVVPAVVPQLQRAAAALAQVTPD
jgi:IclR family acetate operon transcriptional repressor